MATVSILVCTRERPSELERLLASLARLRFRQIRSPVLDVVVVDNTPGGTPGLDERTASDRAGLPTTIVTEPRLGIPFARNRALASRNPEADWVVFIDDDETAAPSWLDHLLLTAIEHEADMVSGPTLNRVPPGVPTHVSDYFRRCSAGVRIPTGEQVEFAATGNLLISTRFLDRTAIRFDEDYGLAGGSDIEFTRRAHRAGARIIRCDRAVTWHWIAPRRTTTEWICRRVHRSQYNAGERNRADDVPSVQLRMAASSLWLVLTRPPAGLVHRVRGDDRRHFSARLALAAAKGRLAGLLGRGRPEEYRVVTDGSS